MRQELTTGNGEKMTKHGLVEVVNKESSNVPKYQRSQQSSRGLMYLRETISLLEFS